MKKKNLFFVAIFFVTSSFAQIAISTSCSLSMENGSIFKNKIGKCVSIFYYSSEEKENGISLQLRDRELWKYGPGPQDFVPLKTATVQAYLYECKESVYRFFFTHQVGISVAVGTPANKEDSSLRLLKTDLFSGVFIELGTGTRISKKNLLIFSLKYEGVYGLIRDGSDGGQAGGTNGFVSLSIRLQLKKTKTKNQNVYLDPF